MKFRRSRIGSYSTQQLICEMSRVKACATRLIPSLIVGNTCTVSITPSTVKAELHDHRGLVNQVGRVRRDDMDTQDLWVGGIDH